MILEHGLPEAMIATLEPILPPGARLRRVSGIHRLDLLLARASGLLLGVDEYVPRSRLRTLARIRRAHPWLPIIVAGPAPNVGLHPLGRMEVLQAGSDRVISWAPPLGPRTLPPGCWRELPLRRLAALVHHAGHLPDPVRSLMARALLQPRPVPDVTALARLAGVHRASLWKIWSRTERPIPNAGLFVDWLQLLHLVVRKDVDRTWRDVAIEVGARPSSVARLGGRLLGQTLSACGDDVRHIVFLQFLHKMIGLTQREVRVLTPIAPPLVGAGVTTEAVGDQRDPLGSVPLGSVPPGSVPPPTVRAAANAFATAGAS